MNTIHIILAVKSQLLSDVLYNKWWFDYDVRVVTNANNELEVASELLNILNQGDFPADDPVIVILSIDETDRIPASCSRLLMEFPEVTILGLCAKSYRIRSYQLRIDVQESSCSIEGLTEALRRCVDSTPMSPITKS